PPRLGAPERDPLGCPNRESDDPVSRGAERAIDHLNDDHADALLAQRARAELGMEQRPVSAE
ncbi:MAG TPA: hypothetical protein VK659_16705, partial [Asanoa sp.]|nr:hypothetical protein [Asanoa sp.]